MSDCEDSDMWDALSHLPPSLQGVFAVLLFCLMLSEFLPWTSRYRANGLTHGVLMYRDSLRNIFDSSNNEEESKQQGRK